jgi:imidazolonepropionase-like amidohydrolase
MMKKSGTWYVPTLSAPYALYRRKSEVPAYVARKVAQVYEAHRESFKAALRRGVKIATGTDAGTPFNGHDGFATELELMAELGMPADHVLRAATSDAAEALGLQAEIGAIAEGKRADIVAVEGDLRRDMRAARRIAAVMTGGRWARLNQADRGAKR